MDSESAAFSTEGTILSVLVIVAAILAVVCLAMFVVNARRILVVDDEVSVLSTNEPLPPPPPEVIGNWVRVDGVAPRRPYASRFVTVVVYNDVGMPIVVQLKEWRMLIAIKLHVYYVTGHLLTHQRLSYNGEVLYDWYQLDDYGWYNGQCVELKVDLLVSL